MNQTPPAEPEIEPPIKILAVDDDPQIIAMLKSAITAFGFQCDTAADGVEALAKAQEEKFAIVLTDLTMPRMDGMTLLRELKNLYPRLDVIVITGYAENFSYTDVIKAGACDFIAKPFNIDELEAKLRRALREQDLVRKLEHISMCDSLTGLHNRRGFEVKLREEIARGQRQNYPVFLAIIDMDKFKSYNDQHGHQAGDEALKSLGRLLLSHTRDKVDWCCRQGGDEFAIILPYASDEQARAVCRRILEQYRLNPFGETTLSIGLARFVGSPQNNLEEDIDNFVRRADEAMYRAKKTGGDRICFDDSLPTD
ncbi:MAG TPA: diguanylate cyclase [Desulfurivibrio alkaliphilus]|uniref:diguanylate cyclase n=1 Tax=Desulfurivibrio alkaliphilus TaxID=427923 RepID=A0A7C2TIV0_9BACT|nr:diguanylate cyclase [Desulfurivibrio alkaliphilus]